MTTGTEMEEIRLGAALTQEQLAGVMRTDISTIGRWERGDRPVSGPASIVLELIRDGLLPGRYLPEGCPPEPLPGGDVKAIRKHHGLTLRGLCGVLRMKDERTARRWEKDEYPITGPGAIVLELMRRGELPPSYLP